MPVLDTHPPLGGILNDTASGGVIRYVATGAGLVLGPTTSLGPGTRLGVAPGDQPFTDQRGGRIVGGDDVSFEVKQNDRRPFFVVALKDDFGEPTEMAVDLTTATSAVFNMRAAGGGAVKVNRGSASITNAAGGEVTYQWGTADTNTAGSYEAEVEITWSDGKPETFPGGPSSGSYWSVIVSDDIA